MAIGPSTNILKAMEDSLTCSLCTEIFNNPRALPCQHAYCRDCLLEHITASERVRQFRCALCNVQTTVPDNKADGFPVAFHQASQLDIYYKMVETNVGSGSRSDNSKCKSHDKAITHLCETCNKLICPSCTSTFHKKHKTLALKSALAKHKPIVDDTRKQLQDDVASNEKFIQEIRQTIVQAKQQKDESVGKIKQQEQQLIYQYTKQVRDHSKVIIDEILNQWNKANEVFQALKEKVTSETLQLEECLRHLKTCLQNETQTDIVKTSMEDITGLKDFLQDLKHQISVPHFTVRVDCSCVNVDQAQVAVVKCHLEGGGPSGGVEERPGGTVVRASGSSTGMGEVSTRKTRPQQLTAAQTKSIPSAPTRPQTLTAKKVQQFDVLCNPVGITCTPAGNVVVCGTDSNIVRMYTPNGAKVMDLQTLPGTIVCDIDSTDTNIYVTDRQTNSVLVFDHQGRLITINKVSDVSSIEGIKVSNADNIRGISVANRRVYITGVKSYSVLVMDLTGDGEMSAQKQFAAGMTFVNPLFVHARGDSVAVSSHGDYCVHVLDTRGRLKYTYGTPGQEGKSPTQLHHPWGVVIDSHGLLFLSDFLNARICVVNGEGRMLGHVDLTEHQLVGPRGIAIDNEGHLLVACMIKNNNYNYCIAKFRYIIE